MEIGVDISGSGNDLRYDALSSCEKHARARRYDGIGR